MSIGLGQKDDPLWHAGRAGTYDRTVPPGIALKGCAPVLAGQAALSVTVAVGKQSEDTIISRLHRNTMQMPKNPGGANRAITASWCEGLGRILRFAAPLESSLTLLPVWSPWRSCWT